MVCIIPIYLKKMKQFISISGHISNTQLIETIVPQGSVLGPLRCFLSSGGPLNGG